MNPAFLLGLVAAQADPPLWDVLTPTKLSSSGGATVALDVGDVIVIAGAVGDKETITLECTVDRKGITGFRLEALPDPVRAADGTARGPGLAGNGNFVLSEFKIAQAPKGSDGWRPVVLERPSADFEQTTFPIVAALDGAPNTGWAVSPQFGVAHEALFETQRDAGSDLGVKLQFTLDFQFGGKHVIGRLRLSSTSSPKPLRARRDESGVVAAQGRVPVAITRGVSWLLSQQELDGAWSYAQNDYHHGMTALAAYALLKCGVRRTHPAVVRAFDLMASRLPAKTYEAGLELMARGALDDEAETPRMEEITQRLLAWQGGGWSYPSVAPDLSNTQYAAMGLRAAALRGIKIPNDAWLKLGDEVILHQEKAGGAYEPEGFGYSANSPAYGSVTTGGVCVLQICHDQLLKAGAPKAAFGVAAKRGLAWLDRYFAPHANPKGDPTWIWYWLYGVERVGGLCNVTELNGQNWYREGASHVVAEQKADGSWDGGGGPQPSTAFALLFLARATSSVSNVTVRGENLYGGDDPKTDVNLRASGDTPLTVWVSSFGEALRDRLAWPQDGGRGPRVARVDYVLPPRPLLADARSERGTWRFAQEPPTGGWELPGFDDAKWKSAPGAFGQLGTAGTAVRTEWKSDQIWLRREFTLDEQPLVAPTLRVQRSSAAPAPPDAERPALLALFDEEPEFAGLLNEGDGTLQTQAKEAYNGKLCLVATPVQRFRGAMPGWSFAIMEKPRPGEYRYLRFAWRKEGGAGIMLQFARNGVWDGNTRRVFAGVNEVNWGATQIDKDVPRKWTVATVDLWKEFGGNGTLTGIAFVAMTATSACFDAIYLGRSVDDFKAIPKDGLSARSAPGAKPPGDGAGSGTVQSVEATGAGPALEVFVNGTRLFASDEEFRDCAPLAAERLQAPLESVLRPGRNVVAVYARRTGAGQSVDVGIEDARLLATVEGKPDAPCGPERFAAQITFDKNTTWPLRARLHVRPPPGEDGSERGEALIESPPLEVRIREALDPELLSYAQDPARNLIAQVGAVASASSAFDGGWLASFAADNLASRGWLSSDSDRHPTLALELNKPVRADTILVTPIQMRGSDAERSAFHVHRIEVQVDQGRGGTFELTMPDDFRKGVVRLPKVAVVRRLDLRILDATGVHPVKAALGLGEVELQLRK